METNNYNQIITQPSKEEFLEGTSETTRDMVDSQNQIDIDDLFAKATKIFDTGDYKAIRDKAIPLYIQAANGGHVGAMNAVALTYYCGKYVAKDFDKAYKWFLKAHENGSGLASYFIGEYHMVSLISTTQDCHKAISHFETALKKGFIFAAIPLGTCYEDGKGTLIDINKAISLYKLVIKKDEYGCLFRGAYEAMYRLGMIYYQGKYVKRNIVKAFFLLSQSAKLGYSKAQEALSKMFSATIENSKTCCYNNENTNKNRTLKSVYTNFFTKSINLYTTDKRSYSITTTGKKLVCRACRNHVLCAKYICKRESN